MILVDHTGTDTPHTLFLSTRSALMCATMADANPVIELRGVQILDGRPWPRARRIAVPDCRHPPGTGFPFPRG